MDDFVHLGIQSQVLVSQVLGQVFLVDSERGSAKSSYNDRMNKHLLCSLICPKVQSSSSTFHDDIRAQTAEDASLVVFGGFEVRNDNIIWIREVHIAGRTCPTLAFALVGKLASVGAFDAENVTGEG